MSSIIDLSNSKAVARATATPATETPAEPAANPLDVAPAVFQAAISRRGQNRKALIAWVRDALVDGVDYGAVPTKRGMSKPSLRKPGAEKICGMLGVTAHFPTLPRYEDAALSGNTPSSIVLRCELQTADGRTVADGIGARSLDQDYGDLNKALKMCAKSAHIDATLRMAGLSEIFTQDLEDMPPSMTDEPTTPVQKMTPNPPDGYARWKADMSAKADEGLEELKAAWPKARAEFRKYATTVDSSWWNTLKAKAVQ